jgi:hypothetical protein
MNPKSFETTATVEPAGDVHVVGVPFAPGTAVEVSIYPRRATAEEFRGAWQRVCQELRSVASSRSVTDEDIEQAVSDHRAGR